MKLRLKCRLQACLALICTFMMIFSIISVQATDTESLENTTSNLQNQLAGINQELLSISNEIDGIEMQVEITNGKIMQTRDSLAQTQQEEQEQYEKMKVRIKYMYETGNVSMLEMLFSADDMTDFLNKADFIQSISEYDRDMLIEIQEIRDRIAEEEKTLEAQQVSLSALQQQVTARQTDLQAKAAATSTDLGAFQAQLAQLRADEAAKLAAEAAAKAAAQETAGPVVSGGAGGNSGGGYDDTIVNGGGTTVEGSELDVFAAILDCEAIHDYNAMLAVATVIMNRVNSSAFPNSITGVVYASGQFEPVWSGKLDSTLARGPSELAYSVANDAIAGSRMAAVSDCYYFLYAASTTRPGVNIGGNLFFPGW